VNALKTDFIELQPGTFPLVQPLFQQTHYGVLAAGTISGGHPGRIFVDQVDEPQVGLVCTQAGYYFLAGSPDRVETAAQIAQLFREALAPQQWKRLADPQVLIFYETQAWRTALLDAFADQKPIPIRKKRMVRNPDGEGSWKDWTSQIPAGMLLSPITPDLLEKHPAENGNIELFWGTKDRFFSNSFGYWLEDGSQLVCTCEAVFIGGGEVEISIATAPEYRRRGLARLTASAFLDACQQKQLRPIWGCWPENTSSIALAQSLGFTGDVEQDVLLVEFSQSFIR
jgi:RimJ/RimL family protein N-acetyltransferase